MLSLTTKFVFTTRRNIRHAAASVPRFTPSSPVYQIPRVGSGLVIPVLFALLVSRQVLLPLEQLSAVQLRKGKNKPRTSTASLDDGACSFQLYMVAHQEAEALGPRASQSHQWL